MSATQTNPFKRFLLWLSGAPEDAGRRPDPAAPPIAPTDDAEAAPPPASQDPEAAQAIVGEPAAPVETAEVATDASTPQAEVLVAAEEDATSAAPELAAGVAAVAVASDPDETTLVPGDRAAAGLPPANDATGYGVTVIPADVPPGRPFWRAVSVHHLTPDENHGNHHLYLDALDEQGARVLGARGRITWDGGEQIVTVDKPANEPGTNFPMWKWQVCEVEMMNLLSDRVAGLHTGHPDEPPGTGNTLFHHSFAVTFQRAVKEDQPAPEPQPATGSVIGGAVTGAAGRTLLLTLDGEIVARQGIGETGAYRFEKVAAGDYVLIVEGTETRSGVVTVDGQSQAAVNLAMPIAAAESPAQFIDRYFLFGAPNSARTAVYLDLARSYLLSRQPTFGFRIGDALHARQVVLMGTVEDISQETEDTLRQAGCQVVRIQGTPQQIQDALRQMDIGGHQVFFPITPISH